MGSQRGHPVIAYAVVTVAWTWSLWWTAALVPDLPGPVRFLLFMTGGLGPLAGAAWLLRAGSPADRRHFLRRIWDPRGVPVAWWGALVAIAAGPAMLGAVIADLAGAAASPPDRGVATVAGVVAFALAAGLVEEPGWRGAASDAWQARAHPLLVAVGIGVLWALWHLPLYLVEGSYQQGLGLGSLRFWLTNLVLVQLGVLYLWLANGSGGSILLVILAHAGFNATGELVPRSELGDLVAFLAVTLATVTVVLATRGRLSFTGASTRPLTPGRSKVDRSARAHGFRAGTAVRSRARASGSRTCP